MLTGKYGFRTGVGTAGGIFQNSETIQNVLKNQNAGFPKYTFKRTDDNSAFATTDGQPLKNDGS